MLYFFSTETGLALPIWAVVLILVLVIILFVGVTALYFCCKQKRKLRKMEKNRILLQRTAPSSHQQSAQVRRLHSIHERRPTLLKATVF